MQFNYPNVSKGYLGITDTSSTLSSASFAEIMINGHDFKCRLPFVQRVPKFDFFTELLSLETNEFKAEFSDKIKVIKEGVLNYWAKKRTHDFSIINWLNILLRFGQSPFLVTLSLPDNINLELQLEFQLIQEQAKIEINLSNDEEVSLTSIITFTEKIKVLNIDPKFIMYALSRVVVNGARHHVLKDTTLLVEYTKLILDLLGNFKEDSFRVNILRSMLYRGIAMVNDFGVEQQSEWLKLAEQYARNIIFTNKLEKIVMLDNLYTCLQTLSKWNGYLNKTLDAEHNLKEMISINPHDSTAYSELGIFLMKLNRYEDAAINFKKSVELGPPGVGMNTYYYAKCLQLLGKSTEAIQMFYNCISYDELAISPWLELFEHHVNHSDQVQAKDIANKILMNIELVEQLDPEELDKLKSYN